MVDFLVREAVLEAFFVGLLAQVQPQLHDDHARGRERVFEPVPAVHEAGELALLHVAAAVAADGLAVPAAEEDAHLARAGELAPVAPRFGASALFVRLHPEGMVPQALGVHPFGKHVRDRAPSRTVHARDDDEHGEFVGDARLLRPEQAHTQVGRHALKCLRRIAPAQCRGFKHAFLLMWYAPGKALRPSGFDGRPRPFSLLCTDTGPL